MRKTKPVSWLPLPRILRRSVQSSFASAFLRLATGSALGQGAAVLAAPLLSRLYGPKQFGEFAVYFAVVGIVGAVAALRYDFALPLCKRESEARATLALAFYLILLVSFLSFGIIALLMIWSRIGASYPVLWWVPLGILAAGIYATFRSWALRAHRYGAMGNSDILRGMGSASLQIGFGVLHPVAGSLALGNAVAMIAGCVLLTKGVGIKIAKLTPLSLRRIYASARRYKRFAYLSTPSGIVNVSGQLLPAALLTATYGSAAGGYYLMSQRLVAVPLSILGRSLSDAYVGHMRLHLNSEQRDAHAARTLLLRLRNRLMVFLAIPLFVSVVIIGQFIDVFLGSDWMQAGNFMQIMAVGWAFQSIASPLGPTMNLLERQDLHLLWDIVRLLGVVAAIVTPAYFGMAVEWSIGFLASNAVLLYGVLILLLPRLIVSQQEEAVHGAAS